MGPRRAGGAWVELADLGGCVALVLESWRDRDEDHTSSAYLADASAWRDIAEKRGGLRNRAETGRPTDNLLLCPAWERTGPAPLRGCLAKGGF